MKKLLAAKEKIEAELAELDARRDELKTKIEGLDFAILTLNDGVAPDGERRSQRGVKNTILEIVNAAGAAGVTTTEVIDRAKAKGRELNESSVSSLLSRLKSDKVLSFDGDRYRPVDPKDTPQGQPSLKVVKMA
jgi:hypothetical protein